MVQPLPLRLGRRRPPLGRHPGLHEGGKIIGASGGIAFSREGARLDFGAAPSPPDSSKVVTFKPRGDMEASLKAFGALCDLVRNPDGVVLKACMDSGARPLGKVTYTGNLAQGLYAHAFDTSGKELGYVYWSAVSQAVHEAKDKKIGTVGSRADQDLSAAAIVAFFSSCQ